MTHFVEKPHLPESKVNAVVMSDIKENIVEELKNNYHIEVISSQPLLGIVGEERYHADMSLCHMGGNKFLSAAENKAVIKFLTDLRAECIICDSITAKKPELNVCFLGNKLICHTKKSERRILRYADENGIKVYHTNQYYTKCSIAVVAENAVMTSDRSVISICHKNKIDVLELSVGGVELNGYDYGFIGGSCGFIDGKTLAFSGKISFHPDAEKIRSFLHSYGIYAAELSSEPLYDIGGILPLTENDIF